MFFANNEEEEEISTNPLDFDFFSIIEGREGNNDAKLKAYTDWAVNDEASNDYAYDDDLVDYLNVEEDDDDDDK